MRLSDVKGERCLEVVADVIAPISSIANDPDFKKAVNGGGSQAAMLAKAAPALIRGHKDDIVAILAAIAGTTPAEYAEGMTMAGLLKDAYELLTDEELLAFLS